MIELKSIGHLFDTKTGMLYPQNANGTADMANGIGALEATLEGLSLEDHDIVFDHKRKYEVVLNGQKFTRTTNRTYATAGAYVADGRVMKPSWAGIGLTPKPNGQFVPGAKYVSAPVRVVKRWMPVLDSEGNQVR